IDSLSVEFSNPTDGVSDEEIKQHAQKALTLQADIVCEFLKGDGIRRRNGHFQERANGRANAIEKRQDSPSQPAKGGDGAVQAQLLNIAGMNTRGGWTTFINVQVNGTTTK